MEQLVIDLAFVVLVAGFAHLGWLVGCLAVRRYRLAGASILTAAALAFVVFLAAGAAWAGADRFPELSWDQLLVPGVLLLWLAMRFGSLKWLGSSNRLGTWGVYAVSHLLVLAAAGWQFQASTAPRPDGLEAEYEREYPMVVVDDAVLVTDQGRTFSVFHFDPREVTPDDQLLSTFLSAQPKQEGEAAGPGQQQAQRALIRISRTQVGPPDGASNCHGWVFAGGSFALSEGAVAAVLQDNGYERVAQAQQGDIAVYRNDAGEIVHTGRVRRVHGEGEVWIESKWGSGGRYLHLPLDQCYSQTLEYYRPTQTKDQAQIVRITPTRNADRILSMRGAATPRSG